ncbi:hypothetical protein LCGC14_0611280 [marine sediment metagenome]|uniref:Uncharacterized protein n=1 Tax=marine sediment metagenome TaxID=412755 RepID=A0A0F9TTW2_9ZZZZ
MFCPQQRCKHWSEATKYNRKCYYEVQCWRGMIDEFLGLFDLIRRRDAIQEEK